MSTATQVCDIVLPGYTLADRIGSGGYAEVWRAEAPGGIQKAIKLVHGYYDDEFASQEMKALERVKGVRHPFLLSLERFEIISGRLVILTELADMSLEQRLRACRADGLSGIPRDELLRYMADAAEAIDYLSQRHQLLHLDIKPENLLILGDHIKVADFGLVKELATRTQNSLVSGMTPAYAAPEMFDDEPSIHSDQYSLAIVYQEMLVGVLPFSGRTAAQLAKQHTQLEPQLGTLPAEDRPLVARALAKDPEKRYPSCKAFVEALLRRVEARPASVPAKLDRSIPAALTSESLGPDDTKPGSVSQTIRRASDAGWEQPAVVVTQPVKRAPAASEPLPTTEATPPEPLVPEDTIDVAAPEINALLDRDQPTLYVALGGVGLQILSRLRALVLPNDSSTMEKAIQSIAFDTDRDALREACTSRWKSPMEPADVLHLPLKLPQHYDNSREILGWLSRRWLYNIPRSLETRGYRPLGRVALIDNSQRVLALLEQKLQELAEQTNSLDDDGQPRDSTIKVVLLAGTGGGTGAGMVLDVANAVKTLAAARGFSVEVNGVLVYTGLVENASAQLAAANTYALLTELNHVTTSGNQSPADRAPRDTPFESESSPFDSVYCIPLSPGTQGKDALSAIAKYLALDASPGVRSALRACRTSPTPPDQTSSQLQLKKIGYASLADQIWDHHDVLAADLAEELKQFWLTPDRSANWQRLVQDEEQAHLQALAADTAATAPTPAMPFSTTPLGLRSRFNEYMSLEVTSEILRQVQTRLEERDLRGRPLISAIDAKLIADSARTAIAKLVQNNTTPSSSTKFSNHNPLRPLIAEAGQRVLRRAIETFDAKRLESFTLTDQLVRTECQAVLEAALSRPEMSAALTATLDLDAAIARTLDRAKSDLLQCGSERRTIAFVSASQVNSAPIEKLRSLQPLATVVTADVENVVVVTEDSGVSPRSFAMRLERVFPGIADAARRLLTRIDIEWTNLV